jgi:hypothetical protein
MPLEKNLENEFFFFVNNVYATQIHHFCKFKKMVEKNAAT